MRGTIPLESDIEDIYRHTNEYWTDGELEGLDHLMATLRYLFRKVERRLSKVKDAEPVAQMLYDLSHGIRESTCDYEAPDDRSR